MAINPRAREQFDPKRGFLTVRPILFNGKTIGPGQPFDVTLVNVRRLRQLYDQRYVKMAPVAAGSLRRFRPRPQTSPELSDAQLRAKLEAHGVVPRRGAPRAKLLELANGLPT
jgi:hypothetical protein